MEKTLNRLKKILLPWSLVCCWGCLGPCLIGPLPGAFKKQPHKSNICLADFLLSWSPASLSSPLIMFIVCVDSRGSTDAFIYLIGCFVLEIFKWKQWSQGWCGGWPCPLVGSTEWWVLLQPQDVGLGSTLSHTWPGYGQEINTIEPESHFAAQYFPL